MNSINSTALLTVLEWVNCSKLVCTMKMKQLVKG